MTRNLKTLGMALLAIFAMSAVAASAASAQFHSTEKEATITVKENQPQVFHYTAGGVELKCNTVTGHGVFTGEESHGTNPIEWTGKVVHFTPHYTNCTALGLEVDVNFGECDYTFTLEPNETTGEAHLICQNNSHVTLTVTTSTGGTQCQYTLKEQTDIEGVIHFENKLEAGTNNTEVTVTPTSTGIDGEKSAGGLLCGPATSTTGTYSGDITVIGEEPGTTNQVPIWVS